MKLQELLATLNKVQNNIGVDKTYIVGGAVRDKYMKRLDNISDIDVTNGTKDIDYLSQEFFLELQKNYNVIRKSMPDGHSTVFLGNLKIDFSSNFITTDIDNILNKKGISNPTDLQKELYSRDFTCNALLMDLNLKDISDPINEGFDDIDNKIIKTCLAPNITLTSSRNRVIRAVYLACKLGFDVDKSIIDFVAKYPNTVKVATEKTLEDKLNTAFEKDADKAVYLLDKMNLWESIPITKIVYPYWNKHKGI